MGQGEGVEQSRCARTPPPLSAHHPATLNHPPSPFVCAQPSHQERERQPLGSVTARVRAVLCLLSWQQGGGRALLRSLVPHEQAAAGGEGADSVLDPRARWRVVVHWYFVLGAAWCLCACSQL